MIYRGVRWSKHNDKVTVQFDATGRRPGDACTVLVYWIDGTELRMPLIIEEIRRVPNHPALHNVDGVLDSDRVAAGFLATV